MADEPASTNTTSTDKAAPAASSSTPTDDKPDAKSDSKLDGKTSDKAGVVMHVRVSSPFKIFFDDDALSLSAENATGPFDILPHHHNFISLLEECELAIRTKVGTTRVRISGGVMHVKADQVVVFLNV